MKKFAIITLVFIAACARIPLETRAAFEEMDVMTIDPGIMRIVLEQANDVPLETFVTLTIGIETPDGPTSHSFVLDRQLVPSSTTGRLRTTFALAPNDHAEFNAFRESIQRLKQNHPDDSKGFVSVAAMACLDGETPDGPILVSVYIGIADQRDLLPLLEDVGLRKLAVTTEDGGMRPCGNQAQ